MSPEQARGETLDGRTDLYAAGIILWELLTGRQLFPSGKAPGAPKDGHTSEEILRRVRNPDLMPPSQRAPRVPPELDRIALKALAPDLKDRYASCEELRSDLATFLAQTSPGDRHGARRELPAGAVRRGHGRRAREREELIAKAREWYSTQAPRGRRPCRPMSDAEPPRRRRRAAPPPLPSQTPPSAADRSRPRPHVAADAAGRRRSRANAAHA